MNYSVRSLLTLAWPVIVARASQAVIGFSDALMCAPLGEEALAAATTGATNSFTVTILPMGLVFIVQSFASQYAGQKNYVAAGRAAWYGLGIAVLAQLLALAAIPFVDLIHHELPYTDGVVGHMTPYLEVRLLAIGPVVAIEALGAWFGGLGDTRPHMRAGLVAMVANVFLNWVFIYGNLGAPALGVTGAAIASSISSTLGFFYLVWMFRRSTHAPVAPHRAGLSWREFRRFFRFGLPNGINWFLEFSAIVFFINYIVANLGTATVAALMVVFQINSVSFMPGFGLSSAGAILVGQAIGAERKDLVPKILFRTAGIAMLYEGLIGLVYLFFPEQLMNLFATARDQSPELVRIGAVMLMMSCAWQIFDAMAMTISEALRGAGDTRWVMWARIGVAWLIFAPASVLLVQVMKGGYVVAMACVVGYIVVLSLILLARFLSGGWRNIQLTEPQLIPLSANAAGPTPDRI